MAVGEHPHVLALCEEMRAQVETHERVLLSQLPAMLCDLAPQTSAPDPISTPSSTSRLLGLNVSLSSGESSPATGDTPPAQPAAKLTRDEHLRRVDELVLHLRAGPYPSMEPTATRAAQRAATASPPPVTSDTESTFDTSAFSPSPPKAAISYLTNAAPAQPASTPPRPRSAAAGRLLFPNTATLDKP